MASRGAIGLLMVGALLSGAAGFAAVADGDGRLARVYDPRAASNEELAEKLKARERSLDRREQSIVSREEAILAEEARLTERTTELETRRAEIEALKEQVDAEHAARVAAIVKTVEAMKPAPAAAMVRNLDQGLAVEVIKLMSSSKAGKLMAALPAGLAASITEGLAGPGGALGKPAPTNAGTP